MQYNKQQIIKIVNTQLLIWFKKDEQVKQAVFELIETKYPTKKESDDKFDRMLKELADDREEQRMKWEEDKKRWDAQEKKWEEAKIEDRKRWDEQEKKWEEAKVEDRKRWDEQEKKWEENRKDMQQWSKDNKDAIKKVDMHLTAIGARWGTAAESSFRDGIKSILETDFPVKVINYIKIDKEGLVYKSPMQVQLDVIIHNGKIILCELSASFSSDEVDSFAKKIDFYELKEKVKVSRSMIISPMMTQQAIETAKYYGIEVFTYPEKEMF